MVVCFLSPNLWIGPSFLHILHTLIPCSFCTSSYFVAFYITVIRNHWFKAYLYLYDTTRYKSFWINHRAGIFSDGKYLCLVRQNSCSVIGCFVVSCHKDEQWLVLSVLIWWPVQFKSNQYLFICRAYSSPATRWALITSSCRTSCMTSDTTPETRSFNAVDTTTFSNFGCSGELK